MQNLRLQLLGDKSNQRGVEGPCLGRLVGDGCALCSVKGFCDGIQVEAPVSDFLQKKRVVKTDSAMLLVGMRPQNFPWLSVRAVQSAVPWHARSQGKTSNVGKPAMPTRRDHSVGWMVRWS